MGTKKHIWLFGGRKEKRPLGRSWRKRKGKMKMDPEEIELMDIAWFQPAQDRFYWRAAVSMVVDFRVP